MKIALERLASQQLYRSRFKTPAEVAAWLGALQGQDYPGAKWSLGLRLPGSTDEDIERALAERSIVRTWALRGTLHFVAAADVRWLVALVAPRLIRGNARRYRELELDERTLKRSSALLAGALRGGAVLSRTALLAHLERNGISTRGQRAPYMLQRASLDGLICQGAAPRNNPTYVLIDEALPKTRALERGEALAELARRYFTSRGPATLADYIWWSGIAPAEARAGLEAARPELAHETLDGQTYWFDSAAPPMRARARQAYLLPGFDEYLIAYRDRRASLLDEVRHEWMRPSGGMLSPTMVLDGSVIGTWKRTFSRGQVVLAPSPFYRPGGSQERAFAAAARRYGQYLGMPVEVRES